MRSLVLPIRTIGRGYERSVWQCHRIVDKERFLIVLFALDEVVDELDPVVWAILARDLVDQLAVFVESGIGES